MSITIENPNSTGTLTVSASTREPRLNGLQASAVFFDEIDDISRLDSLRNDTDRVFQNALNNLGNMSISGVGEVAAVTGTQENQRTYPQSMWDSHTTTPNRTFPDSDWLDITRARSTSDLVMRSAPLEDDIKDLQDDIKYLDRDIIQVNKELQKSKEEVKELKVLVEQMQEQLKMLLEV